jgi:hypothetical protein
MDVRVDGSCAKRSDDLGELAGRDALICRAAYIGCIDHAGHRSLSIRAGRFVLPAAQERDHAAGRGPLAEVDMREQGIRLEPLPLVERDSGVSS